MVLPDRFWPWDSSQWVAVLAINKNVRPCVARESFVDLGEMRIRLPVRADCYGPLVDIRAPGSRITVTKPRGVPSVCPGATASGAGIVPTFSQKKAILDTSPGQHL
jgi:hypothetical protein